MLNTVGCDHAYERQYQKYGKQDGRAAFKQLFHWQYLLSSVFSVYEQYANIVAYKHTDEKIFAINAVMVI